eukprot:2241928-Prymnesium_polylepis.1
MAVSWALKTPSGKPAVKSGGDTLETLSKLSATTTRKSLENPLWGNPAPELSEPRHTCMRASHTRITLPVGARAVQVGARRDALPQNHE